MAATTASGDTLSSMNGLVKEKYADKIEKAVPDFAKIMKMVPFSKKTAVGNFYHQPVILQNEVGFTYAAGNNATLVGYNPVAQMALRDAQVSPTQIMLVSRIGYEVMNRAKAAGEEAFESATLLLVKNMVDSVASRIEMSMLYGGSGLGTIASTSAVTGAPGGLSQITLTMDLANWAVGLWQGQESSALDFYLGNSIVNTIATVPTAGYPTLQAVNPTAKTLLVYGNTTDITNLFNTVASNPSQVNIFWGGAFGTEMVGLKTILTNTGTLFNIDASAFDLWRSNQVDAGSAPLSQALIQQAVGVCTARGLVDEELTLVCSTQGWADLMTSQAALRMYDQSYSKSKMENGAKELVFSSQNGTIRVMAHGMVKNGDAFLLPTKSLERIGACDPTFQQPGQEAKLPFVPLENFGGMQIVRYSSQQIFLKTPAKAALLKNIVNTSSAN